MPDIKIGVGQWISYIAAVITIVLAFLLLPGFTVSAAGTTLAIAICALFSVSLVALFIQEYRYSRKARYAEASGYFHKSIHALRDAWFSWRTSESDSTVKQHVTQTIKELANGFSVITGARCRACVKMIYIADEKTDAETRRFAVRTYCRSEDIPEPEPAKGVDWVDDNTDFDELMYTPSMKCYFKNNLPYPGYMNSHWTSKQMEKGEMDYRATIVFPIRKRLLGDTAGKETSYHPDQDILGFLCIDSQVKNVFNRRYDIEIGCTFSDALYILLEPLLTLNSVKPPVQEA